MSAMPAESPVEACEGGLRPVTPPSPVPRLLDEDEVQRMLIARRLARAVDYEAAGLLGRLARVALTDLPTATVEQHVRAGVQLWGDLIAAGWMDPGVRSRPSAPDNCYPELTLEMVRTRCLTCGLPLHGTAVETERISHRFAAGAAAVSITVAIEHSCQAALANWERAEDTRTEEAARLHAEQRAALIGVLIDGGWTRERAEDELDGVVRMAAGMRTDQP